jgi:hypothetical protein
MSYVSYFDAVLQGEGGTASFQTFFAFCPCCGAVLLVTQGGLSTVVAIQRFAGKHYVSCDFPRIQREALNAPRHQSVHAERLYPRDPYG